MPNFVTINLLKTRSTTPSHILVFEKRAKLIAIICLATVLVAGVMVAFARYMLTQQEERLSVEENRLKQAIRLQKTKEGLFLSIKNRTRVTAQVLNNLKPWDYMLTLSTSIAPPPVLSSISMKADGTIEMKMGLATLEDVKIVVDRVRELSDQGALLKPELSSFSFNEENGYQVSVTFLAGKINL